MTQPYRPGGHHPFSMIVRPVSLARFSTAARLPDPAARDGDDTRWSEKALMWNPSGGNPNPLRVRLGLDRRQLMKRLNGVTALFLSLAFLWSAALTVLAFVVHIPIRAGSHDLVQTTSGGFREAKVLPQTYFQA